MTTIVRVVIDGSTADGTPLPLPGAPIPPGTYTVAYMGPEQLSSAIDAIVAVGRARMDAAGEEIRAIRPTESYWLEPEEAARLHRLTVAHMYVTREERSVEAARARVATKRLARKDRT